VLGLDHPDAVGGLLILLAHGLLELIADLGLDGHGRVSFGLGR
jgi:hypothetical protein